VRTVAVLAVVAWLSVDARVLVAQPAPAGAQPLLAGAGAAPRHVFDGRAKDVDVEPPRIDEPVTVDGLLNEPVWQQAALLAGFSRYAPVDGEPADRDTEVLVWYSPTAMHFGIRATADPAEVQTTLADRDRIDNDDHVLIFLGTFNDGRQAFVFGVNPLGVQMDGALNEGLRGTGGGFTGLTSGREAPDLSPDYVFQSKGRLTDTGYEVEITIPFKSLRYQAAPIQSWSLAVTRVTPHRGVEDSWTPARRDDASFLGQSGHLVGLHDLKRGLVLDVNPVATAKIDGAQGASGWQYDASRPEVGMNVRWGLTANLTVNGTVNPDFSQVESDAGQFQFDPRQALFFPEKRPFFLEGIEQFTTPNNLIYTRRVVSPIVASKLTGKVGGSTGVAFLSAVDDASASATGEDHPVFNILRVQQDIGGQSKAAFVYTDKVDGVRSNRVAGADARLVWRDVYSLLVQGAISRSAVDGITTVAPLWQGTLSRSGRRFAARYQARGVDPDFQAGAGFIARGGIAGASATHQLITNGRPGATLEKWTSDVVVDGTWQYDDFMSGRGAQDRKLHFNNNFTFRGGWRAGGSVLFESFGYDAALYRDYVLGRQTATGIEYVPFTGEARLPNVDYVVSLNTPQRGGVTWDLFWLWGKDENFYEWSSADIVFLNAGAQWRPTSQLRVDARYQLQSYRRRTDDSIVGIRRIPRLKVEYQLSRAVFVRYVGEYNGIWQDELRDDSRTELPIFIRNASGGYDRAGKVIDRVFRSDVLFSYQPTPGTVFFAGYGSSLTDTRAETRRGLARARDGFFLKISYLVRL
jgi:hypothetical protein